MPPRARTATLRGNARPKRVAASEPAPSVATPAKRGRTAQADAAQVNQEPPKKRGRPAKAQSEVAQPAPATAQASTRGRRANAAPAPTIQDTVLKATPKNRVGRPRKEKVDASPVENTPAPKKRVGRPPKTEPVSATPGAATPRRGRPAKNAVLNLHRPVGSPKVNKRIAARSKASKTAPVISRINPRVRSKLRTRVPPANKTTQKETAHTPAKRGRPRKHAAAAPPAETRKNAKPMVAESAKPAKRAKPVAPRKPRGHILLKVADKFADQVQKYYETLLNTTSEDTALPIDNEEASEGEGEGEGEIEVMVELGEQGASETDEDESEKERIQTAEVLIAAESSNDQKSSEDEQNLLDEQDIDEEHHMDATSAEMTDVDAMIDPQLTAEYPEEEPEDGILVDDIPGGATEVEVETSISELVQVQQDGENLLVREEIDTEFVLHDDGTGMPQSILDADDGFVREALRPSAASIFG